MGRLDTLEPWEEVTVYRIAQEAITNARRHSRHASRIMVQVSRGDESIRLTVTNDGDAVAPLNESGGHGLIGMEERVTLLGGQLTTGPRDDGGWIVRATLPLARES